MAAKIKKLESAERFARLLDLMHDTTHVVVADIESGPADARHLLGGLHLIYMVADELREIIWYAVADIMPSTSATDDARNELMKSFPDGMSAPWMHEFALRLQAFEDAVRGVPNRHSDEKLKELLDDDGPDDASIVTEILQRGSDVTLH